MHRLIPLLLFTTFTSARLVGQEWTQFGGDQQFQTSDQVVVEDQIGLSKLWQVDVGDGRSGPVLDSDRVFTLSLEGVGPDEEQGDQQAQPRESVVAINIENGEVAWKYTYEVASLDDQESFGGRSRAPQATPAIIGETLVTLGFSGLIHGLNTESGDVVWMIDAVKQYGAKPVQFGFSASPIPFEGQVIILTGGSSGGLVCLNAADGTLVWQVACGEASYATPVRLDHPSGTQIVFQDRDQLLSVSASSGELLWRFALKTPGLTNVPSPLTVDGDSLIVSGQGLGGTRRLAVTSRDEKWDVRETWSSRVQFFYCNWLENNGQVIGCDGDFLVAIDAASGQTKGKWRGYKNANLVANSSSSWVVDGQGFLTCFRTMPSQWEAIARFQIAETRCWTPPVLSSDRLYLRAGKTLSCLEVQTDTQSDNNQLPRLTIRQPSLEFQLGGTAQNEVDFKQQIVEQFEQAGPREAWRQYRKIRSAAGQQFTIEDRRELLRLAASQGFYLYATELVEDTLVDFPEDERAISLKDEWLQLKRKPSTMISQDGNGIVYVEFAMESRSETAIDTVVRGPQSANFSYGIPFPADQYRIEKWPVGTRLFFKVDGKLGDTILTVTEDLAGKTIKLAPASGK